MTPIKIYCDGGARPNPGRGYSCILEDDEDPIVMTFSHCTNNEAEYRAIQAAVLKVMIDHVSEPVEVYTDCQHFLSFWNGTFKKWTSPHLKDIFDGIKGVVKHLPCPVTFHKISGLLNPAHQKNW